MLLDEKEFVGSTEALVASSVPMADERSQGCYYASDPDVHRPKMQTTSNSQHAARLNAAMFAAAAGTGCTDPA